MKRQLVLALALSLGLHGLGFGAFYAPEETIVQGGAAVSEVRLGTSFADMVSGVSTPVAADITDEVTPEEISEAASAVPTEMVAAETPMPTPPPEVVRVTPSTTPSEPTAAPISLADQGLVVAPRVEPVPAMPTPSNRVAALTPRNVKSESAESQRPETSEAETAPQPAEPVRPVETARAETTDQIVGQNPIVVQQADATTERPRARPERRDRAETPARPAPQGSATQNATRGSSTGTREATSNSASSNNRNATQQGNSAAATNYPGRVWSKLQRGRRSSSAGRGTAVVSFRIAPNGSLAAVAISRSSGNARLDRAALRHVRRAAPFPAPPAGAKTRFNFSYVVK